MKTFNELLKPLVDKAEKNLAVLIMAQEDEAAKAGQDVLKMLLGQPVEHMYNSRQTFTYVTAVTNTLDTMYAFYLASFGKEFNRSDWEPKPVVKVSLQDTMVNLAEVVTKLVEAKTPKAE